MTKKTDSSMINVENAKDTEAMTTVEFFSVAQIAHQHH